MHLRTFICAIRIYYSEINRRSKAKNINFANENKKKS